MENDFFRVIAFSDLHVGKPGRQEKVAQTVGDITKLRPDAVIVNGDLTEHGTVEEAKIVAEILANIRVPLFAVFGNHDHWNEQTLQMKKVLEEDSHVTFLDGQARVVYKNGHSIGFTGTEGYIEKASGVDRRHKDMTTASGLPVFVEDENKLAKGLSRLGGKDANIVIMHYAPGEDASLATLHGEKESIHEFLGSRRYGSLIERHNESSPYKVNAIFHGHADFGSAEGKTQGGIPVYNVSMKAAEKQNRQPFRILDIPFLHAA